MERTTAIERVGGACLESEDTEMAFDLRTNTKCGYTYTLLTGLFNLALALFCWNKRPEQMAWKDWVLLVLATFRMSRLVAYDKIMQPYRAPVVETVLHDSGAGETTQAKTGATGIKQALGEMISCPICNGAWIAAGLVYGMSLAPRYTRTLITIMSAVGAVEILQGAFEALQWNGELARHRAGAQMRLNRQYRQADAQIAPAVPAADVVGHAPVRAADAPRGLSAAQADGQAAHMRWFAADCAPPGANHD